MKKILLDTHILIWLAGGVKVGPQTLRLIQDADVVLVSALSILELRIKYSTGKLPEVEKIIASIKTMEFEILDLTHTHTESYQIFNPLNKDPYDNALLSTALVESIALVTADQGILSVKRKGLELINAKK
ncbi:MAG TPA: type II toxin-antitoxin system VapC family toxin [Candidatus Limnocylindria bacterium]|nr:type II toxin-antitoxin system VapC family toxin [Candidatus Limnocylindria bacterium]